MRSTSCLRNIDVAIPLAWAVVVALHVLYFLLLTGIPVRNHPESSPNEEMMLVLVPPHLTPIQTVHVDPNKYAPKPSPQSRPAVVTREPQESNAAKERQPVGRHQPDQDLNLQMPEPIHDGDTFKQDLQSNGRRRGLTASKRDYFRMRDPITPEDVVKGTAQLLGLWPPGYTTDPCPEIQESIEGLMTDTSASGRRLLDIELRLQQDHCK